LARLLFDIKDGGCVLMEDELEESLHYELLIHYLQTFLQTSGKSQFIFTTHNQQLLNESWMIRRDMVWFTEKDRKSGSTVLSRASDMGLHKNVSLMNAYRIGKLGARPILGSTLISTDL
jgi:AAA15 family ATPase/GTPase